MDSENFKPRRRWPAVVGGLAAVLVVAYFVVTSGWFVRSVVLPQVASSLNSELAVEDVALSPFSSLTLKGVKITPRGAETLATVAEVRVRYKLFAILGGNIQVEEAVVDAPVVTIVTETDGTSNLSKLLEGLASKESTPKPDEPGKPPQIAVKNVALKNGTVRLTTKLPAGGTSEVELTGLNVGLDQLGNGQTGKLTLALAARMKQAADELAATGAGEFNVGLTDALAPAVVNGQLKVDVTRVAGAFQDFNGLGLALAADVTATELKQVRLAFSQAGQALGEVSLNGPYDTTKREARISYAISGIDRRVLGLVAAASGVNFGNTSVTASGRVDVVQLGQVFASNGKVSVNRFALVSTNGTLPELDVAVDYNLKVNLAEKTALAEKLDLGVQQGATQIIKGGLDRPMNIAWDRAAPGFREATFTLTVADLELASWKALAGDMVPGGRVGLVARITADRDGRLLKLDLAGGVQSLTGAVAGARLDGLALTLAAAGSLEDFSSLRVDKGDFSLVRGATPVAKVSLLANVSGVRDNAGGQATLEASLPELLQVYPVEGVSLTGGSLTASLQANKRGSITNILATLTASGLSGTASGVALKDYQARVQSGIDLAASTITLQRLSLEAQSGTSPGGSLDAKGSYDLEKKSGGFSFKSVGLNQSALGPLVAPALAPNRLVSVSIDADGSGTIATGSAEVKTQVRVSNFVAEDPAGTLPKEPLALGLKLDAGQQAQALTLREATLDLGKTDRAVNQLVLSGAFDFATNNAVPSSLNIRSDGLDLTRLYDLFGGTKTNQTAAVAEKPATPAGDPNQEPAPIQLPLRKLDVDVNLAKVFLREVAISNWVAKLKVDGGAVTLDPFKLSLNGAPVESRLAADVGVPGYTYDFAFNASQVPLKPLNNTFELYRKDGLDGQLGAQVSVKGAGITGASLQKNLQGAFELGTTNLNLAIADVQSPLLKIIIHTVTGIPELLRNPAGALADVFNRATGQKAVDEGWVNDITRSPVQVVTARGDMGAGKVNLQEALVQSVAFEARAKGVIGLAPVLTNSTLEIPISLALQRSLAAKANLVVASAATNQAGYVSLPDFLTIGGTVGKNERKIDPVALAKIAGTAAAGLLGDSGKAVLDQATGLAEGVGRLLGGGGSRTNAPTTNAPAGGLLQGVGRLLGGGGTATNTTTTNAPKSGGLLDGLFKKK